MNAMIDSSYQTLISQLPVDLRQPARRLLFDLGLARTPEAGWADVFRLAPCLDLPIFASPGGTTVDERTVQAFQRAHHGACFYNVLVDRIADQQAAATPERKLLEKHFLEHWRGRLSEAVGNEAYAQWAVNHGVRALHLGMRIERAGLARRSISLRRYGFSILLKLGWISTASECLLHQRVKSHRIQHFRRAFQLLSLALQAVDDAEDGAEDATVRGVSFPTALGFPPAALFTASTLLTRAAECSAAQGGFERFAQWLSLRAGELEQIRQRRIGLMDNLAGIVIASSLEAVCLSVAGRTRGITAATTSFANSM